MLQILICTHNTGISNVPQILLPETEGIGYVVSMQYTDRKFLELIPSILHERKDVTLCTIEGLGLSANRNNALSHASADICVIADDDLRYSLSDLRMIEAAHREHPEASVILFQARGPQGNLLKNYPPHPFNYDNQPKGYFTSSIEITFKSAHVKGTLFDHRFGLGSGKILAGEEEVWLNTLYRKQGCIIKYLPHSIVQTLDMPQGGANFAMRPEMQQTKGAVLYYIHGWSAWLRCLKVCWTTARKVKDAHFFTLLRNTASGILYITKTGR